jgi:hypothetical protein
MKGPIQIVKIDENVPFPEQHNYELSIKVDLHAYDAALDVESFVFMLNSAMGDWSDGRRPFQVEEIRDGLYRCLKNAAYEVVCKEMQEKYGNEMVGDERGSTARWLIEAEKVKPNVPDFFNSFKVEITKR